MSRLSDLSLDAVRLKLKQSENISEEIQKLPNDLIYKLINSSFLDEAQEIYRWMNTHSDQQFDSLECDYFFPEPPKMTPSHLYHFLIAHRFPIKEYEDVYNDEMYEERVENGCTYVFSDGEDGGERCNRPIHEDDKCTFHDALIYRKKEQQSKDNSMTFV